MAEKDYKYIFLAKCLRSFHTFINVWQGFLLYVTTGERKKTVEFEDRKKNNKNNMH